MNKYFTKLLPKITRVRHSVEGQDSIRDGGVIYLPKTSGMVRNDADGSQYEAYKGRARFYTLTQDAENGIIGIAFNKPPITNIPEDEIVTIDGKTVIDLARSQLRESLETGRGIMVVDAPEGGGDPYITEYKAESLIDWAVDDRNKSKLIAAKFTEQVYRDDDTYKSDPSDQIREYRLIDNRANVRVTDEFGKQIGEEVTLPLDYIPIFFAGSVDTSPDIDPIPLLPIADAAIAMYKLSADYNHGMFMTSQATPWVRGIDEEQWQKMIDQGMGSSSLWWLGDEGETGLNETSGNGTTNIRQAIIDEKEHAESYAVSLTDKGGVESADALRLRSSAQHASIYTVMDAVSTAIEQAVNTMNKWGGRADNAEFLLNTDFSSAAASEMMLNSINATVNAGNLPRSVIFEYARESGLTQMTDDELEGAILDGGSVI